MLREGPQKMVDSIPLASNPFREMKGAPWACSYVTYCIQPQLKVTNASYDSLPLPSSYSGSHHSWQTNISFSFSFPCIKSISQYSANQHWQPHLTVHFHRQASAFMIKTSEILFWVGQFVSQWHESYRLQCALGEACQLRYNVALLTIFFFNYFYKLKRLEICILFFLSCK